MQSRHIAFLVLVLPILAAVRVDAACNMNNSCPPIHVSLDLHQPPPAIEVFHNGTQFTHTTTRNLHFAMMGDAPCESGNFRGSAYFTAGDPHLFVRGSSIPAEPPVWQGTELVQPIEGFSVPLAKLFPNPGANPVTMCNQELGKRLVQGASREVILHTGFDVAYQHQLGLVTSCQHYNSPGHTQPKTAWNSFDWELWKSKVLLRFGTIRCTGGSSLPLAPKPPAPLPPGPGGVTQQFGVQKAYLAANPRSQTAKCPATIQFLGSIQVAGAGTLKYRVNRDGALGPVHTLQFAGSGSKPVAFEIEVGAAEPGFAAPSGGGSGTVGGYAPNAEPKTKSHKINGFARVEIVSPTPGDRYSNLATYSVICDPKSKS